MRHSNHSTTARPSEPVVPEVLVCDITRKYVRIKETRPDGLVVFEFSIGWPEQMVELVLPSAAFEEFCATHQVQRLDD
jgi:phenol hydroxylase P0 protein